MEEEPTINLMNDYKRRKYFYASLLLAIAALLMILAPSVRVFYSSGRATYTYNYNGFATAFGLSKVDSTGFFFKPSANMITYFAIIIGIIFSTLANYRKMKMLSYIIAFLAYAYAAVGFILTTQFYNCSGSLLEVSSGYTSSSPDFSIGWGAIISIILSALAAILHCISWGIAYDKSDS